MGTVRLAARPPVDPCRAADVVEQRSHPLPSTAVLALQSGTFTPRRAFAPAAGWEATAGSGRGAPGQLRQSPAGPPIRGGQMHGRKRAEMRVDATVARKENGPVNLQTSVGVQFVRALAEKDAEQLLDLLHPQVEFRALTPRRNWEADDREAVLAVLLGKWFEADDDIDSVERLESDSFADRERVGYRFRVSNPEGCFLVEQQAYISERDGRIAWMRVVCSGFRPTDPAVIPAE